MAFEDQDSQFRGSMLVHARWKAARDADRWVRGSELALARDRNRLPIDDDERASELLDSLVELGVFEELQPERVGIGEAKLVHRKFRLTAFGEDVSYGRKEIVGIDVFAR